MGVDANLSLVRIGDGQCFLPKEIPHFVIHPGQSIAILPIHSQTFLNQLNFSTYLGWADGWARYTPDQILSFGFFSPIELGGFLVITREDFEKNMTAENRSSLGGFGLDHHRKFWETLGPGFWAVKEFCISGRGDSSDDWTHYRFPEACQIVEARYHTIWT